MGCVGEGWGGGGVWGWVLEKDRLREEFSKGGECHSVGGEQSLKKIAASGLLLTRRNRTKTGSRTDRQIEGEIEKMSWPEDYNKRKSCHRRCNRVC